MHKWLALLAGGLLGTAARYWLAGATCLKGFLGYGAKSLVTLERAEVLVYRTHAAAR